MCVLKKTDVKELVSFSMQIVELMKKIFMDCLYLIQQRCVIIFTVLCCSDVCVVEICDAHFATYTVFCLWRKTGLGRLITEISKSHTIRHTQPVGLLWREWSACRRGRYLYNTQRTQQTSIHALRWIRNGDPSNQAAADLHLKPRNRRDR
jgi:hypothetical protein